MVTLKEKVSVFIRNIATIISPEFNTRLCYRVKFGRNINLENPKTFNEKISWLKLNDYRYSDLVKKCADKYRVRDYVIEKGCSEILNKIYGVYNSSDEIDWSSLPKKFVIKFNTGCGANIICTNKSNIDIKSVSRTINSWFNRKFYLGYAEMQYKGVPPKIIIEKYLSDTNELPEDYKFFCFNGEAKYVMVCVDRQNDTKYHLYDRNWNWCKFDISSKSDPKIKKPDNIDRAFEYADKLSEDFIFVRTDLYVIKNDIYFGELTFTPAAGLDNNIYHDVDILLGKQIAL